MGRRSKEVTISVGNILVCKTRGTESRLARVEAYNEVRDEYTFVNVKTLRRSSVTTESLRSGNYRLADADDLVRFGYVSPGRADVSNASDEFTLDDDDDAYVKRVMELYSMSRREAIVTCVRVAMATDMAWDEAIKANKRHAAE